MTEPAKDVPAKPTDKKKLPPTGYKPPPPSYADAADGLGWYLLIDGIGDLVGSLLD